MKYQWTINSACIIPTASEQKDSDKYMISTKNFLEAAGIKNISFIDIEEDSPQSILDYDLIVIGGGNPYKLFYRIKKTKSDEILLKCEKDNKIILGISAGAVLLSSGIHYIEEFNNIMNFGSDKWNNIGLVDLDGIGFTNHIIFPHYDMFLNKESKLEDKLREIETRDNIKITRLNNEDAIMVIDHKEEWIEK